MGYDRYRIRADQEALRRPYVHVHLSMNPLLADHEAPARESPRGQSPQGLQSGLDPLPASAGRRCPLGRGNDAVSPLRQIRHSPRSLPLRGVSHDDEAMWRQGPIEQAPAWVQEQGSGRRTGGRQTEGYQAIRLPNTCAVVRQLVLASSSGVLFTSLPGQAFSR